MRFSCGTSKEYKKQKAIEQAKEKAKRLSKWKRKFAFCPVTVEVAENGKKQCIWLDWYEERLIGVQVYWDYVFRCVDLKRGSRQRRFTA